MNRHTTRRAYLPLLAATLLSCLPVLAANVTETPAATTASPAWQIADGGFEAPLPDGPNRFGHVFKEWPGWIFSQPAEMRASTLCHGGKLAGLLVCDAGGAARFYNGEREVAEGRYRLTFYLRALDVQAGAYGENVSICFYDNKWHQAMPEFLGTYGWRKVTHVVELTEAKKTRVYIGLKGPGRLWVDDVTVDQVGEDVPLTETPQLGPEEKPITPPGTLEPAKAIRCADCGTRNLPEWQRCYACGSTLEAGATAKPQPPRTIASFENGQPAPFTGGQATAVAEHATDGRHALCWQQGYISWDAAQDWHGYDYLRADFFVDGNTPVELNVEVRDQDTKDYWTRVNYGTVLLPGANTFTMPTNMYVGEKSRPGRALRPDAITRVVLALENPAGARVYLDNVRLECDPGSQTQFPELYAFDFGLPASALMRGMTRVTSGTTYNSRRGYGFRDAKIWRSFDVLQPDSVYRDFVCIERGAFAVDVPNGRYHVVLNIDCPGGYWGELPKYRRRAVSAEGKLVAEDTMDRAVAMARYFRFADSDDLPTENTFDKYLGTIFKEKAFDVDVTDGRLDIEFEGENWANCLSMLVAYPVAMAAQGTAYLTELRERRRAEFDNYFKRLLHQERNPELELTATEKAAGFCCFSRPIMDDIYADSRPLREEVTRQLKLSACAGELESAQLAVRASRDLGRVTLSAGELRGPAGVIPAAAVRVGYVSNRVSRVAMDGSLYTIRPRYVMNQAAADLQAGVTRAFWITAEVPPATPRGTYSGELTIAFSDGRKDNLALTVDVWAPPLAALDVPVGPWGLEIRVPWFDEEMADWNRDMDAKCLQLMRRYGCTVFATGLEIEVRGKGDTLQLDCRHADDLMQRARAAGMLMVVNYGALFQGVNLYGYPERQDPQRFGFTDLADLYQRLFAQLDKHAQEQNWLPLVITACDEPLGDNLAKAASNAALLKPLATPRLRFGGATSLSEGMDEKARQAHLLLARNLNVPLLCRHDAWALDELQDAGGSWAYYNDGNRWTYGVYMFALRQERAMDFRLGWHWNCNAGDPYYALDCREDDFAWANANARGELVTSLDFERIREGIDDYRYLLTLQQAVAKQPQHPKAPEAKALLAEVKALVPGKDAMRPPGSPETVAYLQALRARTAALLAAFAAP